MKNVFVTGSTGLVGSWLIKELLSKSLRVVCLIRDFDYQSELVRSKDIEKTCAILGKLEDEKVLKRALVDYEIDTVFHLGAQTLVQPSLQNPKECFESNIQGTWNLLEACRQMRVCPNIVIASSDKAYGFSKNLPYTEEMPLNGSHPYDVSKSCTDLIAKTYANTYQMPIAIARCGNIYGGGDLNFSRLVPTCIEAFLFDKKPILRSDGTAKRDYLFVEDVVYAYIMLAEALEKGTIHGEAFNFGPNQPMSVLEVCEKIQHVMGCTHLDPIIENRAKHEIQDQTLSSKKAHQILGWQMQYSLEEGFKKTIEWYANYFNLVYQT